MPTEQVINDTRTILSFTVPEFVAALGLPSSVLAVYVLDGEIKVVVASAVSPAPIPAAADFPRPEEGGPTSTSPS
jgi:hypothetical protein